MQTPTVEACGLTYQALPVCFATYTCPRQLAAWAAWVVIVLRADGQQEAIAGWLAPGGPRARGLTGHGQIRCYLGGVVYGPDLAYVTNARSSRQGTRQIAEAHQAWLARQGRPRRSAGARR
jgi:hypothetical protein